MSDHKDCVDVRIIGDFTSEVKKIEVININLTIGRMICLAFKFTAAMLLANLIILVPLWLLALLIRAVL